MRLIPLLAASTALAICVPAALQAQGARVAVEQSMPPLPANLNPGQYPGTMRLVVDASDVAHAIMTVEQHIPVANAEQMTLRFPEWLPGKHAPRGAIGDMAGLNFSANGQVLNWRRDVEDVYSFHVDVPRGAREITVRFQFLAPTRESEGRVNMTPAMLNLQFEQVSLYPAGYATRNIRVQPSVILPTGWQAATALDGATNVAGTQNRINYGPTDYETLIDSPMFAGAHFRRWDLGQGVHLNVVADDAQYLEARDEHIAAHRALVSEAVALFGTRHFDHYELLLALTEEMGGIGLEHHRSSENARETDYFTEWDNNGSERGLLPHELTHSWNGKYRRPAHLWTPDYATTMDGRLLWVYEGQTAFWDLVLAARSGMQTSQMVIDEWARNAAFYAAQPGRAWRSVEDTTLDPVMAARRPRPFPTATRTEDYYNEASLMWLEADQIMRRLSGGARGMDNFARNFFGGHDGDWGTVTYEFDDVVAALQAVQPYDWAQFLNNHMRGVGQPAPIAGLEAAGYRLVWRDTPSEYDGERMKEGGYLDLYFSLGININRSGEVSAIQFDSPMFNQGVTNGTRILAVNGLSYNQDRMRAAIRAASDGTTPITLLVEKGGRYRTITPQWTGGLRYPHTERASSEPNGMDALLTARRPQ